MRGMVRSVGLVMFAVLALGSLPAAAQSPRIIITEGADYAGHDLRTVQGVDLDACQRACLGEVQCRAFTFNESAGWCFLKSDFGALSFANGATAGRVVSTPVPAPGLQDSRRAELEFLPGQFIEEAEILSVSLADRFKPGDRTFGALLVSGHRESAVGRADNAATAFGRALAIASDDPENWLRFANASLARRPAGGDASRDATAGAVNAYLRASTTEMRARALATIGTTLESRSQYTDAIHAYLASVVLVEDSSVRASLDRVAANYGFRVETHEVDSDSASPRICVVFTEPVASGSDLADYVTVDGATDLAIEAEGNQICVEGVSHGGRYKIGLRAGLPAEDGQVLPISADLDVFVPDRAPWVGFGGNAYVLPAGQQATLPMSSVNTDIAEATIYRIGDRALASAIRSGFFLSQLDGYRADEIADERGELVWEGEVDIQSTLNETVTTAIPVGEALGTLKPGVYAITTRAKGSEQEYWEADATQWFIVSDLGLTALSADDGVHVFVRSLASAKGVSGVRLTIVAVNQEVLGEAVTDAEGYATFPAGLARGSGGLRPQVLSAESAEGDYAFLDVDKTAFDLTDRGVDGRPAPGPIDIFATTERGVYRPGETVHFNAFTRDVRADAVEGLPLTLVVERPDGNEDSRTLLQDAGLGGFNYDFDLIDTAMRGSWRFKLYVDPEGDLLSETAFLVEDFVPERLDFELTADGTLFKPGDGVSIDLSARYLYGAPAVGLSAEGEVILRPVFESEAFPGYHFGREDDTAESIQEPVASDEPTDAEGNATINVALPLPPSSTRLFKGELVTRLVDLSGRAVERRLDLPLAPDGLRLGVKPLFADDEVGEGGPARFELIAIGPEGTRVDLPGVEWSLDRLETHYQWYSNNGNWNYDRIVTTRRIDAGNVDVDAANPTPLSVGVDWGRYRLEVSGEGTSTTYEFYAGWYVADSGADTPDALEVALDRPSYAPGETALLRIEPRFAGTALVTVMDDRVISRQTVEVGADGATVSVPVTDDWGAGAYVTAILYRPMDIAAGRMPARALGLAWATVAPGDRDLAVALDLPEQGAPRSDLVIPVSIGNLTPGEKAFVTVAAVDLGILNLTGFEAPAPEDWYFGQRELGVEIRDFYGQLIDPTQGVLGRIRSGGDGPGMVNSAPPPTEKLVAFHSGIVEVDSEGKAVVTFAIPDFNGTVRVMAMAWSRTGVGHAVEDIILRDPVVVTATIPRFLNFGDLSRLSVEIDNVDGPAGDYRLAVDADPGIALAAGSGRTLSLAEDERIQLAIPIGGEAVGDHLIRVSLTLPDGTVLPKDLVLGVRPAGTPVTHRTFVSLNGGGGQLTLDGEALGEFVPGTGYVTVAAGASARLDLPHLLDALDRYPYGCAEQITSRALPLVYLDEVAQALGIGADKAIPERINEAIRGVLAKQGSSGGFGLWGPGGGDLWLDSYVTDFLTRAKEKGYAVPELANRLALDNLANAVSYAGDFTRGGEEVAYALYVLARNGRALIGDLRYYVESKLSAFATPLAKAQLGAALALYGDRNRSETAFRSALADLGAPIDQNRSWRDYGSQLRDGAAILTLAAETSQPAVNLNSLAQRIADWRDTRNYTSTQEQAWMLLAAAALIEDSARASLVIDGAPVEGSLFRKFSAATLFSGAVTIENRGPDAVETVVNLTGIPLTPPPAGGNGFSIERNYYLADGTPAAVETVAQNDRFVVVLNVAATSVASGQVLVVDPLPAGFEIENPNLGQSGNVSNYSWLQLDSPNHTEARTDRFVAAFSRDNDARLNFTIAYTVRAVSPGTFVHPAATVEDMYRPERQARTATGTIEVVGATR